MANEVIKADGSKQPFDEGKIRKSIEAAGQEAGLEQERIAELVNQVSRVAIEFASEKEEIATSEIKETILSELDKVEPSVSESWRKHDQAKDEA